MARTIRSTLALLVVLLGLLGAACGDTEPEAADPETTTTASADPETTTTASGGEDDGGEVYAGHYSTGFEVSAFTECGSGEAWWVRGTADLQVQAKAANDGAAYEPVFVRVRGTLSEPGTYGHLGAYPRELTVTEVIEVSTADGC